MGTLQLLTSCDNSQEDVAGSTDTIEFRVPLTASDWHSAFFYTRAYTRADDDITIAESEYPDTVIVSYTDGATPLTLTKSGTDDTDGYYAYHTASQSLTKADATGKTFTAHTCVPFSEARLGELMSSIPAFSTYDYLKGETIYDGTASHILFTLAHQQAMVRFCFQEVDALRSFRLTKLMIGDVTVFEGNQLISSTTMTALASVYVSPSLSDANKTQTITCTYDVYDLGADGYQDGSALAGATVDDQLTRKGVTVRNKVTLSFTAATEHPFPTAGYYYDLQITLDPDFLYVLSDNDDPAPGLIIKQ